MLGKGKSDPYAVITVGAQEFKTKTIDNTVDPKWDFWCEVYIINLYYILTISASLSACALIKTQFFKFLYEFNFKVR